MIRPCVDMGGGCSDLSEPQVFKNAPLQMMTDKTYTFRRIYFPKTCSTFKFLTVDINGTVEAVPFYRFQL